MWDSWGVILVDEERWAFVGSGGERGRDLRRALALERNGMVVIGVGFGGFV